MYRKYCTKDSKKNTKRYENIREYVHLHGKMKPTYETIDALYERYMCELAQILIYSFYRPIKVETNPDVQIQNIVQKLVDAYNAGLPYRDEVRKRK